MRYNNFFCITAFIILLPVALFAATAPLPATGQKTCHDSAGKEIACSGTGQDGELKAGISIPAQRFVDNRNGTVTDKLTGLVWLKDANCLGTKTWQEALDAVKTVANGKCGLNDRSIAGKWRLPNINELESLVDLTQNKPAISISNPFTDLQMSYYWSSTTKADEPVNAWYFYTLQGAVGYAGKNAVKGSVWPVRGGI